MAEPSPGGAGDQEAADLEGSGFSSSHSQLRSDTGTAIPLIPPCRLVVRGTAASRVIGKAGESIRAVRANTGASVKVLQDELPEPLKRREEAIVVISCGEADALRAGVNGVLDRVFDRSGIPNPSERSRERPYAVDVVVPERAARPLVGPGGERIKALIEELDCNLDVVREPLVGVAAQKRVRVLSRDGQLAKAAVWRLQEIMAGFLIAGTLRAEDFELRELLMTEEESSRMRASQSGGEVPVRILLAQGETALIVGRMGQNVMRLRDIAHVSIDDATAPPFDPSERVCFVGKASLGDRIRVVRLVVLDLASRQSPEPAEGSRPVTIRLVFPSDRSGELAGLLEFGGLSVTGAEVRSQNPGGTPPGRGPPLFIVELRGMEEQVAAATWRLHQTLEPWEPIEIPPPDVQNQSGPRDFTRGPDGETQFPVFVGGLAPETTREALRNHFAALGLQPAYCGLMTDRETGESRGMARVAFASEDAQRAAMEIQDSELDGRKISVREYTGGKPASTGDVPGRSAPRTGGQLPGVVGDVITPVRREPPPEVVAARTVRTEHRFAEEAPQRALLADAGPPATRAEPLPSAPAPRPSFPQPKHPVQELPVASAAARTAEAPPAVERPCAAGAPRATNEPRVTEERPVSAEASRVAEARASPPTPVRPVELPRQIPASWQAPASELPVDVLGPPALTIVIRSQELAVFLASDSSCIALRSGAKLRAQPQGVGQGVGQAVVEIRGSPAQGAMACYFVQVQLWLAAASGRHEC